MSDTSPTRGEARPVEGAAGTGPAPAPPGDTAPVDDDPRATRVAAARATWTRHLVDLGSVVIGIDIRHYRDQVNRGGAACQDFSGDFENLSHAVQQRLGLD